MTRPRRPTPLGLAAFSLLALLVLFLLLAHNPYDLDLGARLATGRLVLESGSVPRTDPFAWTPRYGAWIDHEWGAAVVFESIRRIGGLRALFWLKAALLLAACGFLLAAHRAGREDGRISWGAFALLVPALLPAFENTVRAQVFTFLLFAAAFSFLARASRSGRFVPLVFFLPVCALLGANLHGGAIVLPLLVVAALPLAGAAPQAGRRTAACSLLTAAALAAAALFATPYGPALPLFLVEAVAMDRPGIREWRPPDPSSPEFLAVFGLALFLLVRCAADRRLARSRAAWFAAAAAFLLAAFLQRRHLPLAAAALFVAGGEALDFRFPLLRTAPGGPRRLLAAVLVGAAAGLFVACLRLVAAGADRPDVAFHPVEATESLSRVAGGGRLLCGFNEGSFAIERLWPRWRVSLDGRYEEVYPERTKRIVQRALEPWTREGRAAFRRLDPDAALFRLADGDPGEPPAGYVEHHRDDRFVVWLRSGLRPIPEGPAAGAARNGG